jgi:ABC-type uncharacterized transport system ATPase subunit
MYVRLAFATAVVTDPQILIIDEALSVGDAVFQHRCLRRIKQMQENGTTILLVSHDVSAVKALCSRAILLNSGRIEAEGKPPDVLNRYLGLIMEREEAYAAAPALSGNENVEPIADFDLALAQKSPSLRYTYRHGDRSAEVLSAEVLNASRQRVELVETGDSLVARMRVRFHRDVVDPVFGFLIRNRHGISAYGANTEQQGLSFGKVQRGEIIEVSFPFDCWLGTDLYSVSFAVHSEDIISYDWLDGVIFFRVISGMKLEGLANLNASAVARRLGRITDSQPETRMEVGGRSRQ